MQEAVQERRNRGLACKLFIVFGVILIIGCVTLFIFRKPVFSLFSASSSEEIPESCPACPNCTTCVTCPTCDTCQICPECENVECSDAPYTGVVTKVEFDRMQNTQHWHDMNIYQKWWAKHNWDAHIAYSGSTRTPFQAWSRLYEYPWVGLAFEWAGRQLRKDDREGPVRFLDAGASLTFMDWWVLDRIAGSECLCIDLPTSPDPKRPFHVLYPEINAKMPHHCEYQDAYLQDVVATDGSREIVLSVSVMEHVPKSEFPRVAQRVWDVLSPGGFFILTMDIGFNEAGARVVQGLIDDILGVGMVRGIREPTKSLVEVVGQEQDTLKLGLGYINFMVEVFQKPKS